MGARWWGAALFAVVAITVGGLFKHPSTSVPAKVFALFYGVRAGQLLGVLAPPEFLVADESFEQFSPELVAWQYIHSEVLRVASSRIVTPRQLTQSRFVKTAVDGVSQAPGNFPTELSPPATVRTSTIEIPSLIDDHQIESDLLLPKGVDSLEQAPGAIISLHGGAHVRGSRHLEFGPAAFLANATGLAALNLRIRLLPHNTVEQHLGDVISAVHFLRSRGIAAGNVVLYGCSAGANMAILSQIKLLESGHKLGGLLLASPGDFHYTHMDHLFASHSENQNNSMLSQSMLYLCYDLFGRDTVEQLRFLDRDFAGFPPVNLVLGEYDMIRDHGVVLGERLAAKFAVDVVVNVVDGGWHCPFFGSAFVPEARRELEKAAGWISGKAALW